MRRAIFGGLALSCVLTPLFSTVLDSAALASSSQARDLARPARQAGRIPGPPAGNPLLNPALPMVVHEAGDTVWVNVHAADACPGDAWRGGEATGGPDARETWCFEGGPGDSSSVGPGGNVYTFRSHDHRTYRDDLDSLYWHATTFLRLGDSGCSMWCGGFNTRCGNWEITSGGYGNYWQQIMQLELGPFSVTRGCSLQFRARYALECNYDHAFLEYYSFRRGEWRAIDLFNGKSGCLAIAPPRVCNADWNNYRATTLCPGSVYGGAISYPVDTCRGPSCPRDFPAYPYVNGNQYVLVRGDSISATPGNTLLRLRWRVETDGAYSSSDGHSDVKGFWLDDVTVRVDHSSFSETFDGVPEGGLPGPPWSFPSLEPIYDGWAIRYDLDPPLEGYLMPCPCADSSDVVPPCEINGSWQWSVAPYPGGIPAPNPALYLPGPMVVLESPAIPLDYADEDGGPFAHPGAILQRDEAAGYEAVTCDYTCLWVRTHLRSAPPPYATGAWCEWSWAYVVWLESSDLWWNLDLNTNLARWSDDPAADSIQVAWVFYDAGHPGDSCWDPLLPPHVGTQYVVDNVSVGLVDTHQTVFYASSRNGIFQDTFNLHTCMHSANLANGDLGDGQYLLQSSEESLEVTATDFDGLAPGNVLLNWSFDGGGTWETPIPMNLSEPDPFDPSIGGCWRATICDTPWTAGTEISYFVTAQDHLGNVCYFPRDSSPGASSRRFLEVDILPTPGAKILFVDDYGRASEFYHPCRLDTLMSPTPVEDFYEDVLRALGYEYMTAGGYDKYDVNAASSNQRINEPWGFWAADPDSPEIGLRQYDAVIWTTGMFNLNTIQDTTQTFLKQFVFHGGKVLITGDQIGRDIDDPATAQDPDFYPNLLGSEYRGPHPYASNDADRFPKVPATPVGTTLLPGDSLHIYSGCSTPRLEMDKITLRTTGLPAWSHPGTYLRYEDTSAPLDSVAGIYNWVWDAGWPDTGKVVYLPFSLDALVDHWKVSCDPPPSTPWQDVGPGTFSGRGELLKDILGIFDCPTATPVEPAGGTQLVDVLYPAQPNPFNPETIVRFSLAARGRVALTVYDILGRRVRTLADEVRSAGAHSVRWDGRDDSLDPVASGLYFVRLQTQGFTATEKITLLK